MSLQTRKHNQEGQYYLKENDIFVPLSLLCEKNGFALCLGGYIWAKIKVGPLSPFRWARVGLGSPPHGE